MKHELTPEVSPVILEELSDAELLQIVDECKKEGWENYIKKITKNE